MSASQNKVQGLGDSNAPTAWAEETLRFFTQSNELQTLAITFAMTDRCRRYLPRDEDGPFQSLSTQLYCDRLVRDFVKTLDKKSIHYQLPGEKRTYSTIMVFIEEFKSLLQQPLTLSYLEKLNSDLESSFYGLDTFHLLQTTQIYSKDQSEVLQKIAVLFQDNSTTQSPRYWLMANPIEKWSQNVPLTKKIVEKYEKVMDQLHDNYWAEMGHLGQKENTSSDLYPKNMAQQQSYINGQLYHYYVPAYLAHKIKAKGHGPKQAFFAPFIFNYLYEVGFGASLLQRAFTEPKTITDEKTLQDIYSGYAGALLGAGLSPLTQTARDVFYILKKSPKEAVNALTEALTREQIQTTTK